MGFARGFLADFLLLIAALSGGSGMLTQRLNILTQRNPTDATLDATDAYVPHAATALRGGRQMRLARVLRFLTIAAR
jgi:hypothetical protein